MEASAGGDTEAESLVDGLRGEVTINRVKRYYHERNYKYYYEFE